MLYIVPLKEASSGNIVTCSKRQCSDEKDDDYEVIALRVVKMDSLQRVKADVYGGCFSRENS